MEKKAKFTNESLSRKFSSNFELVNYAIRLAENMIRTGRDARVKSEVQNRAMLILEEIHEGKDHFDEIKDAAARASSEASGHDLSQEVIYEERPEKRKYRTAAYDDEE